MQVLHVVTKALDKVSMVLIGLGIICLTALMLLITGDVAARLLLNKPISGSYELVQLLFSLTVFTGFIASQRYKAHIQISLFLRIMPGKLRFIVLGLVNTLGVGISGIITAALWNQAGKALNINSITDVLSIPVFPFYYLFTVFMAFFTLQLLVDTAKTFFAITNQKYAQEIVDAWI